MDMKLLYVLFNSIAQFRDTDGLCGVGEVGVAFKRANATPTSLTTSGLWS